MKKMIIGTESEYSFYFKAEPRSRFKVNRENFIDFSNLFSGICDSVCRAFCYGGSFYENGGRLYVDTGAHPEFATPECLGPREVVKYLRAGDLLMEFIKGKIEAMLAERGYIGKIIFCRDTTAYNAESKNKNSRVTYSAHENYLTSRDLFDLIEINARCLADILASFFVTRQIITGAGCIFQEEAFFDNYQNIYHGYVLSPRLFFLELLISSRTTTDRALISIRDEPLANIKKYGRLHILAGDANRSDWSNWLKFGITGLIISILNENPDSFMSAPRIQDPLSKMRELASYFNLNQKIFQCYNYQGFFSAIEIQRWFLERVDACLVERDDEDNNIIAAWAEALDILEENDPDDETLDRRLDWRIKLRLFKHYKEKKNLSINGFCHPELAQRDIEYHNIASDSLFSILENEGLIERLISKEEIEKAVLEPPLTRAFLRSLVLQVRKNLIILPSEFSVDWTAIKASEDDIFFIDDPFATSYLKLEKWVNKYKYIT
ncbi:MAG: proteasome accessory factor PafA2 family protein [Parcubacteria group bacterium]|nr:proteasome accessory factor PafA2 family protein [Parcubacteria group bacterium]